MHKHRFYTNSPDIIIQPEYHHIVDVLRYKEGDTIFLFDGRGNEYTGRIEFIDKKKKQIKISIEKSSKEEINRPLVLVQSLVKSMDIIMQKATELGVTHIYPVIAENSIVKKGRIDRWRKITEAAGKQCGRSWLPCVDKIWGLEEALNALSWVDSRIVCTPSPQAKGLNDLPSEGSSTAVMIGPEGDFTKEELKLICSMGWVPVHLGKTLLRAETAAISVLGALCYKFGYWD